MLIKKPSLILLVSLGGCNLYGQTVPVNLDGTSLSATLPYTNPLIENDNNTSSIQIKSNKASANYPEKMLFSGNVKIQQGSSALSADKALLTQKRNKNQPPIQTITADGNVNYANNEIKLYGLHACSNLDTKDTEIYQGHYKMVGRQGRGAADIMKDSYNKRYTVLKNASFTSCPDGDNSWVLVGSKVIYDREKQVAKIWNARFKIGKVPIFYAPYFQVPLGNKRQSGLLFPKTRYTKRKGFALGIPYYLNFAPNYDATITPNYLIKHGPQIQTEFRYRTFPGKGVVELDWLHKDLMYRKNHTANKNRWLFYWHHNGMINQMWYANADYTKVSDSDYFKNLHSAYGRTISGYIPQKFSLTYANKNWESTLLYKQFQVLSVNKTDAYRAAPQFSLNYYKQDLGPLDFKVLSQATKFIGINNDHLKATRLHVEPTLGLPLANRWGTLNTEVKLMATHYQQQNIDYHKKHVAIDCRQKNSMNRILPQFKTEGKVVLERNMDYFQDYTQILVPQLQYLYIPYRNQDSIRIYDSVVLQTDHISLFRDRTHGGLDRISYANQLTGAITTRIYDNQHIEKFSASVGHIYHFSQPSAAYSLCSPEINYSASSLVWAEDASWHISNQWGIRGSAQHYSHLNKIAQSDLTLEYRRDEKHAIQLAHRYSSLQHIKHMFSKMHYPNDRHGISQMGMACRWLLIDRLLLVGSYYYDTLSKKTSDRLIGLQYNTCCWGIKMCYEQKINGRHKNNSKTSYDSKMFFNIELHGLNKNYNIDADKIMKSRILPYQSIL